MHKFFTLALFVLAACGGGGGGERVAVAQFAEVCADNPFDSTCGVDFDDMREDMCRATPDDLRCPDTLARICAEDPFDALCASVKYSAARVEICRFNPFDTRCFATIDAICKANPLDDVM